MTLILTLVRHGESTDNLKALWAGHRDAPLTTHGMNQARRLGKSLEDVYISKIYASDLKRAHWTALQIATQNKSLLARLEETASSSGAGSSQFVTPTTSRPSSSLDTNTTSTPDQPDDSEEQMEQEDLVETTAGPSSLASTDRLYSNVNPSSDYNDDFSCSSSAAASSPVPSPTSATSRAAPNHAEALLPKTVTTTNKLREQYFGLAEGQNWKTGFATSANSYHNRGYKFEQGESLEDVHARAQEILHRCVVPWLVKCSKQQGDRKEHVVLVAHGIMISELLFALHKLQDPNVPYERRSGHTNTGWTRFTLSLPRQFQSPSSSLPDPTLPDLLSPALPPFYHEVLGPAPLPKVIIKQTHTNVTSHLDGLKRTKGGVGSEQFDARQKSLRDFFSGAQSGDSSTPAGSGSDKKGKDQKSTAPSTTSKAVPDPRPIDLTSDDMDDGMKTNGEQQRRGVRLTSPPSPSPKKSRLS